MDPGGFSLVANSWEPATQAQFTQQLLMVLQVNTDVPDGTILVPGARVGFVDGSADFNLFNDFSSLSLTVVNPNVPGPGEGNGGGGGGTGPGATPELDSLVLFGSGMAGLLGLARLKLRGRR